MQIDFHKVNIIELKSILQTGLIKVYQLRYIVNGY